MPEDKKLSQDIMGRTIVSKSGKNFGIVGDLVFETRTGELIYMILHKPTEFINSLNLEKNSHGEFMIPFSSVMSIGDFVIVSEEDII